MFAWLYMMNKSCWLHFWWLVRGTLLMESGLLRDFLEIFPREVKDIIFMWRGHARWLRDENCYARWEILMRGDFCGWRGHLVGDTQDAHEVRIESHLASTLGENFDVVEGTLGHARWTWCEIWKVISHTPHVRTLVWWRGHLVMLDGCEGRFEKSSLVHLMWELCIRCYLFDVPRPNDEDLQDFPLIYLSNVISCGRKVRFEKSSCVHLAWELLCAWSC